MSLTIYEMRCGKQIFRCCVWKVPDGMIPSRAEKAAQKAAVEWERQGTESNLLTLSITLGFRFVSVTASISLQQRPIC